MRNARSGMERDAFTEGGTALAGQARTDDTNAVRLLTIDLYTEDTRMPSRRHNQAQPADAIAMLKADHQRVKDLFAQYEAADDVATKRMLAEQAFVELETHTQLEENVFYPAVNEETDEGPELVKESLSEHETVKYLIQELRSMGHDTDEFDTKFQELIQNVEHHVEEEEAEMFPLAEEELAEDLTDLKDEMQELKVDLLGS
jgi:hemerythrin-like domain-containing protein